MYTNDSQKSGRPQSKLLAVITALCAVAVGLVLGIALLTANGDDAPTQSVRAAQTIAADAGVTTAHGPTPRAVVEAEAVPVIAPRAEPTPAEVSLLDECEDGEAAEEFAWPCVASASAPRAGLGLAGSLPGDVLARPWDAAAAEEPADGPIAVVDSPEVPNPTEAKAVTEAEPAVVAKPAKPARSVVARSSRLKIVESALALDVEDRAPVGVADAFGPDAGKVWAWVKVENTGPPTTITMVWRRGEEVAWRLSLDVGTSDGWRTWSRKTVRAWDVGEWSVDVLDADGALVDTLSFEITPPDVTGGAG